MIVFSTWFSIRDLLSTSLQIESMDDFLSQAHVAIDVAQYKGEYRIAHIELISSPIEKLKPNPFRNTQAQIWLDTVCKPLFHKVICGFPYSSEEIVAAVLPLRHPELALLHTLCPFGQTLTYGSLAEAFGYPKNHARRVGSMLAMNTYALLIPCHRVVHQNTSQKMGYRWGSEIKRHLLAYELKASRVAQREKS